MESGRVFQINISKGGVPKHPIHEGQITEHGLAGDMQADLKNHGGSDRALCLFSLELILMLQKAGHPIFPGSTGENLTITGLAWDELRPGVQLWIGAEVCIEITSYTQPCYKIKESFVDRAFARISQTDYPGSSRLYARVLKSGTVRIGDTVSPNQAVHAIGAPSPQHDGGRSAHEDRRVTYENDTSRHDPSHLPDDRYVDRLPGH